MNRVLISVLKLEYILCCPVLTASYLSDEVTTCFNNVLTCICGRCLLLCILRCDVVVTLVLRTVYYEAVLDLSCAVVFQAWRTI